MEKIYNVTAKQGYGYYVARELQELDLKDLASPGMLGKDAFSMLVFKTESGALYKIYEKPDSFSSEVYFMIKKKGWGSKEYNISRQKIQYLRIRVGYSFVYPNGNTTPVSQIYGVCTRSVWAKSYYPKLIIPEF
ncbi:MAG: hypothetical protein RBT30_03215 [Patescibacteria group bacterium]|jgi:hypothetical protein|nr:hypothetical protein [Patescibacteria group bacterium]